jgi:hypothetical protein
MNGRQPRRRALRQHYQQDPQIQRLPRALRRQLARQAAKIVFQQQAKAV